MVCIHCTLALFVMLSNSFGAAGYEGVSMQKISSATFEFI